MRRRSVSGIPLAVMGIVLTSAFVQAASAGSRDPGDGLWVSRYNGPGNSSDYGRSVATDGTRVYVTGFSDGLATGLDFATTAYDRATGSELWVRRYDGSGDGSDFAVSVATDGTGVYVTGTSSGSGTNSDYATVAYDAITGDRLWVRRYTGRTTASVDEASFVATDGTGVYVTGNSSGAGGDDYATVAYDAVTGVNLWVRRYNGPRNDVDRASSVATDGTGVYVTGNSSGSGLWPDYATVAYDAATGDELWARRYDGPSMDYDVAYSVATDGTGVYVTGYSLGRSDTIWDYATVAYDATSGDELWIRRYDGPGNYFDYAYSVATDGTRVYVTGESEIPGPDTDTDYATVAYDATTGDELWVSRYDGNNTDVASSVATDGTGVYVTGRSYRLDKGYNYATVAYDATTGDRLWLRRYNGPANGEDEANSVATDGTGVYVTGESDGLGTGHDYATVAYEA